MTSPIAMRFQSPYWRRSESLQVSLHEPPLYGWGACASRLIGIKTLHDQQDSNPHLAVLETVIFPLNYGRIYCAVGRGIEPLNLSRSLVFETSSSSIRTPTITLSVLRDFRTTRPSCKDSLVIRCTKSRKLVHQRAPAS